MPSPTSAIRDVTPTPEIELTLRLGRLAYEYGLPGYELDGLMTDVGAAMGMTGKVIATPTYLDYTVDARSGTGQHRMMATLGDVSYDLGKLSQTMRLADQIRTGSVPVDAANQRLDEIEALRPYYDPPLVGVAYAACGAGFAVILSAAWRDVGLAAALSVVVFLLVRASSGSEWLSSRINVVASFVASVLASLVGLIIGSANSYIVGLCAFVVLIPGLGLTLGVYELAIGHTLLGWNRFISSGRGHHRPVRRGVHRGDGSSGDVRHRRHSRFGAAAGARAVAVSRPVDGRSGRRVPGVAQAGAMGHRRRAPCVRRSRTRRSSRRLAGPVSRSARPRAVRRAVRSTPNRTSPLIVVLPGILILVPGVAAYASLRALDSGPTTGVTGSVEGVVFQIFAILAGLYVAGSVMALPGIKLEPAVPAANEAKES